MKTSKFFISFLVPSILSLVLSGCTIPQEPAGFSYSPEFGGIRGSDSVARRFEEPAATAPTTVDSAIELSKKYVRLSEQVSGLKQEKQTLIAENTQLKDRAVTLKSQLQQTEKELAEANKLLREMVIELNNWKTDVIGYRDEMRGAEKAQLEALLKILKVLGGKARQDSAQLGGSIQDANSIAVSKGMPITYKPQETLNAGGDPNEEL